MQKYIAEFLGTFTLAGLVGLSVTGAFPVATPVLAALVLGTFVYTIGHISGTHINPGVTLGLFSIGKIKIEEAAMYIVAQMAAGFAAMLVLTSVLGKTLSMNTSFSAGTLVAETAGMTLFTFGIASVVYGRANQHFSGVVVGVSLLLGVAVAALMGSNGVLNPAVALGIGSFGISYILGPIFGAVIGFNLYKWLSGE